MFLLARLIGIRMVLWCGGLLDGGYLFRIKSDLWCARAHPLKDVEELSLTAGTGLTPESLE